MTASPGGGYVSKYRVEHRQDATARCAAPYCREWAWWTVTMTRQPNGDSVASYCAPHARQKANIHTAAGEGGP